METEVWSSFAAFLLSAGPYPPPSLATGSGTSGQDHALAGASNLTHSLWPEHRLDGLHWSSQGCLGGKAQAADS